MNLKIKFIENFKNVILHPKDFYKSNKSNWKDVAIHLTVLSFILFLLPYTKILIPLFTNMELSIEQLPSIIGNFLLSFFVLFSIFAGTLGIIAISLIFAGIIYFLTKFMGSKRKFICSFRIAGYGLTPWLSLSLLSLVLLLFSPINEISIFGIGLASLIKEIGIIWSLVLFTTGIKEQHKLSLLKSVVPSIIIYILLTIVTLYLI